jgi:hypothetical protein
MKVQSSLNLTSKVGIEIEKKEEEEEEKKNIIVNNTL